MTEGDDEINCAVYTVRQVSRLLKLSRNAVYEAIRRGDIPSVRIGRRILVLRSALEEKLRRVA